jgi:hypothetical protein
MAFKGAYLRGAEQNTGSTRFPGPGMSRCAGHEDALAHRSVLAGIVKPPQPMPAQKGAA